MGCGGSSEKGVASQNVTQRQKISYQVGHNVKVKGPPTVVYVYGGPGSKKGKLVADLMQTYDFKLINVETLLTGEMEHTRTVRIDGTNVDAERDFQEEMREKERISLSEILQKIIKVISKEPTARYLVDIMPNLRALVCSDSIINNCNEALTAFHERYPISFALHFSLPLEKITRKHDAKVPKINEGQAGPAAKSDEADSTRTKKRATLFEQNVKPFLDYFRDQGKLITIDVSGGHYESIWFKVCELFADLHLPIFGHPNTVIIVTFEATEIELINFSVYQLNLIEMRSYVDSTDNEERVLTILHQKIREKGPTTTNFLVDLRFTCLARLHKFKLETDFIKAQKRAIAFADEEEIQLEEYVAMQTKGSPCRLNFQVISSTDNCVFLFSKSISPHLCKRIALFTPKPT